MKGKLRRVIGVIATLVAMGMSGQVMAANSPTTVRASESKIIIRADSAATYAVQGGHVVSLVPSTNRHGRTFFTIGVQKGSHLYQVVVDPVTDQVLAVTQMH
ncbi:hypothetical protein [Sulfobacillus thermosulfidooxidans]|uniref:hypothetical protein n=1 Tax=Sulfobacillus thermosulfidooxidans TaxID=28034 RepID=UPI000ABEF78A|nr:hypothetical protein [Sulfobacillus thermosulfidooxidans]